MDDEGSLIVVGFDDGVIRTLQLHGLDEQSQEYSSRRRKTAKAELVLVTVLKPHSGRVTCLARDVSCHLIASGVSAFKH